MTRFEDKVSDALLKMAQDGLITINGDIITLTEKGRKWQQTKSKSVSL